jgi:hypothetical protein
MIIYFLCVEASTLNLKIKACLQHKSQISDTESVKESIIRSASLLGNPIGIHSKHNSKYKNKKQQIRSEY